MSRFDLNNFDWASNRERIAYHEAGHAVATWARGLRLLEVHIESIRGHSQHVESCDELVARLGDRETIFAKSIIVLAGEFAQKHWEPNCLACGCDQDNADANSLAERLATLDRRDFDSCRKELRTATEGLVDRNWPRVEALAAELLSCGTIPGDEAVVIIECAGTVRR